jgi:tetratricopeptide (TPR) repeat protein
LANEVNPPDIEEENTDSVALHTEAISKEALAELQVELSNNQTEEEEEEEQVQLANEVNPPDIEEENTDSVALHTEAISKEALAELQAYLLNTTENESANLPVEPVPNNEAIEAAAQKSLEEDPDLLLALQQKIANYKQVLHMQANPVKTDEPNSIENEENMEEADLSPTGIVTERLAKVYARQGYYDEAIKIYKQLILKFPEKRRYFAVRIEELRNKLV